MFVLAAVYVVCFCCCLQRQPAAHEARHRADAVHAPRDGAGARRAVLRLLRRHEHVVSERAGE